MAPQGNLPKVAMPGGSGDDASPEPQPWPRYLVELSRELATFADVRDLADRARRGAGDASLAGAPVRFLRVVFVPDDGTCLLLYEAAAASAVTTAVLLAGLERVRVTSPPPSQAREVAG